MFQDFLTDLPFRFRNESTTPAFPVLSFSTLQQNLPSVDSIQICSDRLINGNRDTIMSSETLSMIRQMYIGFRLFRSAPIAKLPSI
jgi:hypothetical protein